MPPRSVSFCATVFLGMMVLFPGPAQRVFLAWTQERAERIASIVVDIMIPDEVFSPGNR